MCAVNIRLRFHSSSGWISVWQKSHTFLRLSTLSIVNPLDVFAFRSDIGKDMVAIRTAVISPLMMPARYIVCDIDVWRGRGFFFLIEQIDDAGKLHRRVSVVGRNIPRGGTGCALASGARY